MSDFIVSVLTDIIADISAHQIEDLIHRILAGENLAALAHGGNEHASLLMNAISQQHIDLGAFSDRDWGELAELVRV